MRRSEAIDPDHGHAAVRELERGGCTHRAETDDDHVRGIGRGRPDRATAHGMSTILPNLPPAANAS